MNRQYRYPLCALALFLTVGCQGGKGSAGEATDADSTATAAAVVQPVLTHLPDTVMPSVSALKYTVDTMLPGVSGRLNSLEDLYTDAASVMTFRGSPRRDAPMTGRLDSVPSRIDIDWAFTTRSDSVWGGGSGWSGQPVLLTDNGRSEVIVGSLDGRVYFIDLATGKSSRDAIHTGNPIKGSVSLDPVNRRNLYVGHGIPNRNPFGAITIDIDSGRIINTFGRDPKARRGWGAYDSSPIRVGQFLFRAGENGTFYKWLINDDGSQQLHSTLRYTDRQGRAPGIESSPAVWRNYGYFADNYGNILCVNLDTMTPVWTRFNSDDTDASPIIAEEEGHPFLYTGSEIDKQGQGTASLLKLDALTGDVVWDSPFPGRLAQIGSKHFDGGFYATPLLGRGRQEGLMFANIVFNTSGQNGALVAIDRKTGREVWRTPLQTYSWSSPVAMTDREGNMYIVTGDTYGNIYVVNAADGRILARRAVGNNFESSPIVADNSVVVGSRGNKIFKMSIH